MWAASHASNMTFKGRCQRKGSASNVTVTTRTGVGESFASRYLRITFDLKTKCHSKISSVVYVRFLLFYCVEKGFAKYMKMWLCFYMCLSLVTFNHHNLSTCHQSPPTYQPAINHNQLVILDSVVTNPSTCHQSVSTCQPAFNHYQPVNLPSITSASST